MTALTRRHLLAGAAATGAGTALAQLATGWPARAAAPPLGKQAPGYYRYKVGDFELTTVHDGGLQFPLPDTFVRNAPKEQVLAALDAAYMTPKGQVRVPFNPTVINTGSKLVLIDAGYGFEKAPAAGQAVANMTAAGIDPKAIDIVILSHLHPDHINGIKAADGGLAFPNAEIKAPAADWAFWMDDANMAKAKDGMMKGYFENTRKILSALADKITRYDWGKEVAPGITSVEASGHTPGHTAFVVASGPGKILIQSDVTNIPQLFLVNPDWHVAFDVEPEKAQVTRHRIYDMAAAEHLTIAGFHFPFPSVGHVEKDGPHYRLIPVIWSASL